MAERANEVTVDDVDMDIDGRVYSRARLVNYLGSAFDRDQLDLLEAAFESHGDLAYVASEAALEQAVAFAMGLSGADRLRLVWENVIANDGTFKPEVKPVKRWGKWTTPGYTTKRTPAPK
jgi:hypothetical protein